MNVTVARQILLPLMAAATVVGCHAVPVTPWVSFAAYSNPNFDPTNFGDAIRAWKAGQPVNWSIRFKGSEFASQELLLVSNGPSSLGPRLATAAQPSKSFTPTRAELSALLDRLVDSGVFTLYDGHYGAYLQGGGAGGPELTITIGDLLKHVSKDDSLSPTFSHEADIINKASNDVADLALKYVK